MQLCLELVHVAVRVPVPCRLAEADAVDDRRVIQRIGNDGVVLGEQRFEQTAVGVEAGGKQDRVLRTQECRQALLELAVNALGTADESDRRHSEAPAFERGRGGRYHFGMIGESKVVVGAQVQELARIAVGDGDVCRLRRCDHKLLLVDA